MDISIEHIDDSKGLIFSKALLNKYNFRDKVEIILEKGYIVLRPVAEPRKGWEKAFKEMNENGDDKSLMTDVFEDEMGIKYE